MRGHSSSSHLSHIAIYDFLCIMMIILLLCTLYRWGPPALWGHPAGGRVGLQTQACVTLQSCFFPDQLFSDLLLGTQHRLLSEFRTEPSGLLVQPRPLKNTFEVAWDVCGWLTYLAFVSKGFRKVSLSAPRSCSIDTQGRFLICELFVGRWQTGTKGGQSLSCTDTLSPLPLE